MILAAFYNNVIQQVAWIERSEIQDYIHKTTVLNFTALYPGYLLLLLRLLASGREAIILLTFIGSAPAKNKIIINFEES